MPITPDPYLLHTEKVDATALNDDRAVQVGGNVEQRQRHERDLTTKPMASTPEPYPCAHFVDWVILSLCMVALAVVSVPELRAAAAEAITNLIR